MTSESDEDASSTISPLPGVLPKKKRYRHDAMTCHNLLEPPGRFKYSHLDSGNQLVLPGLRSLIMAPVRVETPHPKVEVGLGRCRKHREGAESACRRRPANQARSSAALWGRTGLYKKIPVTTQLIHWLRLEPRAGGSHRRVSRPRTVAALEFIRSCDTPQSAISIVVQDARRA
jgi:hypothetical protein